MMTRSRRSLHAGFQEMGKERVRHVFRFSGGTDDEMTGKSSERIKHAHVV